MVSIRASPACGNCRSRRIKCNLLKPRCSQCARAGLACSGYRSQSELLFRDQTKSTMNKVQSTGSQGAMMNNHVIKWSLSLRPTFNMDELAQKVFSDNFPVLGKGCKSWMESGAEKPSSVTISFASVGLAALAVVHKDPQMMNMARRKYNSAIKALTAAIVHHGETGLEQSIAASFILSIFEMITCDNSSDSNAWQKHVFGAAAFLDHLCSSNGLPVSPVNEILDICFTTTLACLVSDRPIPSFLLELPDRFEPSSNFSKNCENPLMSAMRLFALMATLVNLRVSANHDTYLPSQFVAFATQSDQALQEWANSLPRAWKYDRLAAKQYYIYQNSWFARIWNYYRLARILANRITLDNLDMLLSPALPGQGVSTDSLEWHYEHSSSVSSCLLQDIYDTLPFMFDSEHTSADSLPLSATLFFITTILQSLLKVTDRSALFADWSTTASEVLGQRFTLTKSVVIQNLRL